MLGEARHNEVAHASEACKCFGFCTESLAQAAHFGLATREDGSAGIVTDLELAGSFEAIEHTRSNCNHVLHGTTEFNTNNIRRSIDAEVRAAHSLLHDLCGVFVHASSNNGGQHVAAHFFGVRRTAKGNHLVFGQPWNLFEDDFAHKLVRAFENTLRGADDNRFLALCRGPRAKICGNASHKLRRNDDKDHIAAFESGVHIGRVLKISRENNAREFVLVLVFSGKKVYFCLRIGPKSEFVLVFVNNLTEGQAPATGT